MEPTQKQLEQEIFNKVYTHLMTQRKPALINTTGSTCAYRNENGEKCAVGCLIEDNEYEPEFEGKNIGGILERPNVSESLKNRLYPVMQILSRLQGVHDSA